MDKETMEREFYITRQCKKFFHPLYKVKSKRKSCSNLSHRFFIHSIPFLW